METPTASTSRPRIRPWLPYWAVLQTDLRQTLRSWIYRIWVLASLLAAAGYIVYRMGMYREAGMVQSAAHLITDLLRWCALGSMSLIIVLTVGSIASERGTLADSILSRGISRHQYFLAKWHARLIAVVATFLVVGAVVLTCSHFLLHEDMTLNGCLIALAGVAAILGVIVSCGVTVGALTSSGLVGVTVLWIVLYGVSFLLTLVPENYPSPHHLFSRLPAILRGTYADTRALGHLVGVSLLVSLIAAAIGLIGFARRDV